MPSIGLNRVLLIGHVASQPRFKITPGKQLPRLWLRVRTDEAYRDENGIERERRAFHTVVVWGGLATSVNGFLREGHAVAVEGRLSSRQYEVDGSKRYQVEVTATKFVTLTPKGLESTGSQRADLDAA